jgi:hypothetical protein
MNGKGDMKRLGRMRFALVEKVTTVYNWTSDEVNVNVLMLAERGSAF